MGPFRDEREALLARNASLERENAELKRKNLSLEYIARELMEGNTVDPRSVATVEEFHAAMVRQHMQEVRIQTMQEVRSMRRFTFMMIAAMFLSVLANFAF